MSRFKCTCPYIWMSHYKCVGTRHVAHVYECVMSNAYEQGKSCTNKWVRCGFDVVTYGFTIEGLNWLLCLTWMFTVVSDMDVQWLSHHACTNTGDPMRKLLWLPQVLYAYICALFIHLSAHLHISIHMYVHIRTFVCISYVCIYLSYLHVSIHMTAHLHVSMHMYQCICINAYVSMHMYIHARILQVHVCRYTHTRISTYIYVYTYRYIDCNICKYMYACIVSKHSRTHTH